MGYATLMLVTILMLPIFTFLPHSTIAETEWKVYKLSLPEWGINIHINQVFKIPYSMSNGDIQNMYIPPPSLGPATGGIFIQLENATQDGTLKITVPMELVHEGFGIVVDEKSTHWQVVNGSPCFRTYSIKFPSHSNVISMRYLGIGTPFFPIYSVYVTTDKSRYNQGENVTISGCTSLSLDDRQVGIDVLDSEGKALGIIAIAPNIDGSFSSAFHTEGATNSTYTVKATYAGHSATSSFVIPEFPVFGLLTLAIASSLMVIFTKKSRFER